MSSANIMAWIQMQQAQMEADRQTRIQQQKERERKQNKKDAERKKKADTKAVAASDVRVNSTIQGTLAQARERLVNQGYTGPTLERILTSLQNELGLAATSRKGDVVSNPQDVFNLNGLDKIVSDINTSHQASLKTELDKIFGKDFESTLLPETADDAWIADIIGKQSTSARERLEAQLKRGTINQTGFDAGLADLDTQSKAATAAANKTGLDTLTTERGKLTTYANDWFADAANELAGNVNDPWDAAGAQSGLNTKLGEINKNLEGSILGAIGNTQYFDIDNIIAAAGLRSGSLNNVSAAANTASAIPGANGVTAPLENRSIDESEGSRLRREGIF